MTCTSRSTTPISRPLRRGGAEPPASNLVGHYLVVAQDCRPGTRVDQALHRRQLLNVGRNLSGLRTTHRTAAGIHLYDHRTPERPTEARCSPEVAAHVGDDVNGALLLYKVTMLLGPTSTCTVLGLASERQSFLATSFVTRLWDMGST